MKKLIYIFLVLAVLGCKESSKQVEETVVSESVKSEAQVIEKEVLTNLDEYITLIDSLNVYDISSIKVLKNYVINKIYVSDELADSAYYLFMEFFYTSAKNLRDSVEIKYPNLIEKLYKHEEDSEVREFLGLLDDCGLDLYTTDGYFNVEIQPDFFYETFKDNSSPSLKTFLQLRDRELKNAFSKNAILLISFNDLAHRIYNWERYLNDYPDTKLKNEANYFLKIYRETFLTGMDNTRLFDTESRILLHEVKQSYESYIKNHADTKSGMIIQEYYEILKRNQFKYSDSINYILKKYNLNLMHGIQPHVIK
ncbi:MAG: hypothetical protein A2W99_17310 [Bacteroidetes bacterium GWF2_33_16]|nr:MAG: hypothetical protein A2X00_14450 [Bacteroidetes bacterium GWE2_32_14]OFY06800.1 MAG: hypothetical protein A2W99_17310 [Bacteroidetes bacterium GWF2_33_16]